MTLQEIADKLNAANPNNSYSASDTCVWLHDVDGIDYAVYAATLLNTIVCFIREDGHVRTPIYRKRT